MRLVSSESSSLLLLLLLPPRFFAFLLFSLLSLVSLFIFSSSEQIAYRDVDLHNPVQHIISSQFVGSPLSCERVRITGLSRLKFESYASSVHVTLMASDDMPERHHGKVELCFHRNASIELCQCEKDEWRNLQNGQWSTVMSPYLDGYIDVKFIKGISGSITISLEEEFQQWRLICLGIGFVLLLLAPIVSNWAPFYYSSSMALGIMLVVLFLLFQGMKLLPTGRRNIFYLTIYGSVLGAGSFLLHHFSIAVNAILVNFGLSEEMYNPVSIFLLVGIILVGAALGYWIVHKFVLSEDGSVDAGIAQFVKWAMRIMGTVFIFQSTLDTFLAAAAVITFWNISAVIISSKRRHHSSLQHEKSVNENLWKRTARQATTNYQHAEFLYPSRKAGFKKTAVGSLSGPYSWSRSPPKGRKRMPQQLDYYSTFHNLPNKCKWSKKEWEDFTRESTRDGLATLSSSPEFTEWIAENAHRIRLEPKESSSSDDENVESSSDSSEETVVEGSTAALSFLKWL